MSLPGESSEVGETGAKNNVNCIRSLGSEVLDLPPSCLEFSTKWPNYFVVGTYNLQKDEEAQEAKIDDEGALEGDLTKLNLEDDQETSNKGKVPLQTEEKDNASREGIAVNQSRNGSLLLYSVEGGEL